MNKKGIFLGYIVFALIIVFLYFGFYSKINNNNRHNNAATAEDVVFFIKKGDGAKQISDELQKNGIIKNSKLFQLYSFLSNARSKFLPGEYHISSDMSFKDLIDILTTKPLAQEVSVTIIEGLSNKEIAQVLEKKGILTQDDFFAAIDDLSHNQNLINSYDFLSSKTLNPIIGKARFQGYLFPDTYRFYKKTTAKDVIKKMLANFNKKLNPDMRAKIKQSGKSIYEALTLASIIEKEANLDQDRRLIADIFWKRLSVGWALQSDATINYILNTSKLQPTFNDTRTPSLYNTYIHTGLPPSPINNPSLSAIYAAINPIKNDYCCFLVRPDGVNVFSKTIEEHNQNKAKYLK